MKYVRTFVVVLFLVSIIGYGALRYYDEMYSDKTNPVIQLDKDVIEVSVKDPEEALLEGVSAWDKEAGDLTDEIVIENMGPFLSDGSRKITYVVCDKANNIGRATRTLIYSDYEPPQFFCGTKLRFPAGKELNLLDYLTASDVLDGNLTNRIRQMHGNLPSEPEAGEYEMGYQVANSAGDVSVIDLTVEIYDTEESVYIPDIDLKQYICYIEKGKHFDPYQYIDKVTVGSREYELVNMPDISPAEEESKVSGLFGNLSNREGDSKIPEKLYSQDIYIDNPVKVKKTGTYTVTYKITTEDEYTGSAKLFVVVYDRG